MNNSIITQTPSDRIDRILAFKGDTISIVNKLYLVENFSTLNNAIPMTATFLNPNFTANYSRFRITKLLFSLVRLTTTATSGGAASNTDVAFGFTDDGNLPSTDEGFSTIADYRCSKVFSTYTNATGSLLPQTSNGYEIEWRPLERKTWFYTNQESGDDARLTTPTVLAVGPDVSNLTINYRCILYYWVQYSGQL